MGIAIIAGTMMTIDRAAAYLVRKYFRHGFAFTGSMMASQAQAAMYGILKNNAELRRSAERDRLWRFVSDFFIKYEYNTSFPATNERNTRR